MKQGQCERIREVILEHGSLWWDISIDQIEESVESTILKWAMMRDFID